jgi:TonB family protein
MMTTLQKIQSYLLRELPADPDRNFEERFFRSALWVSILFSLTFASIFLRQMPSLALDVMHQVLAPDPAWSIYPVLVDQMNPSPPVPGQMRAYSDVTSGGRGGITAETGFHTLSSDDTLFISLSGGGGEGGSSAPAGADSSSSGTVSDPDAPAQTGLERRPASGQGGEGPSRALPGNPGNGEDLPMRIPMNYRFRDDFALRWDSSPSISIATQELAGYKYFRDMMRQIRENFAPPGLNLAWRDQAGTIISQPIKPQVVRVLFLLDREGTVRDVRIVSSMGQVPVDEACYRVLYNQNFGPPPPEVFKHGNIFGINFLFPPVYR